MVEAFVLGAIGSTIGLGLGILLAMAIRTLFGRFGLDLSGQSLILAPRTVLAAYAVGIVVTLAAAWLPAHRTGRIAPIQAMRDDVAMPESSLHRRLVVGVVMMLAGGAALAAGLMDAVPRPGWFVGGGILLILLGVAVGQPGDQPPVPGRRRVGLRPALRHRRPAGGAEQPAQPAPYDGHLVGADDRPVAGVHDGHRRRVGQGQRRPDDRGELRRRLRGQLAVRAAVLARGSPATWRGWTAWSTSGRSASRSPAPGRTRRASGAIDPVAFEQGIDLTMVAGDAADLRDGTVILDEEHADERSLSVGDTYDVDLADGPRELEVVGDLRREPDPALPGDHHAPRRSSRRATATPTTSSSSTPTGRAACRTSSRRWSPTCRS